MVPTHTKNFIKNKDTGKHQLVVWKKARYKTVSIILIIIIAVFIA